MTSTYKCDSLESVDQIMGNINNSQESKSWSKLDKTSRLKALINYAESYKNEKGLDDGKYSLMVNYFK